MSDAPTSQQPEEDLEREIQNSNKRSINFEWINKPITIFALSTCLIGLISYCFTNFSTCHSSFVSDSEKFNRLWQELSFRAAEITDKDRVLSMQVYDSEHYDRLSVLSGWEKATDPSINYLYAENRGRFPYEILSDAQKLLRSWYPPGNYTAPRYGYPYLLSGNLDVGLIWWRQLFTWAGSPPSTVEARDAMIVAAQVWADQLSMAFYAIRAAEWTNPLPASACTRRTFLPFVSDKWFDIGIMPNQRSLSKNSSSVKSNSASPGLVAERIDFSGNAYIPDGALRSRLTFAEGDKFEDIDIKKSIIRINSVFSLSNLHATAAPSLIPNHYIVTFFVNDSPKRGYDFFPLRSEDFP